MNYFSCTMEITNSSSSVLSDPGMYLPSGQCSVPLSPLLMPGSSGSATCTGPAGIDLMAVFTYNLPDQRRLAVWFNVPSSPRKGYHYVAVELLGPVECDDYLLQRMNMELANGPLKASKSKLYCNGLVARATMSDTTNAVLKVNVSNVT